MKVVVRLDKRSDKYSSITHYYWEATVNCEEYGNGLYYHHAGSCISLSERYFRLWEIPLSTAGLSKIIELLKQDAEKVLKEWVGDDIELVFEGDLI